MLDMKSLYLMVQKFWPRLNSFLPQIERHRRTDRQKLHAPEFHFRGHKIKKKFHEVVFEN